MQPRGWKYLDSTVPVSTDTWTHVASTYDGSRLIVWINGALAGSVAVTGTTCSNNRPLAVGAKNYPGAGLLEAFWDGQLDDIHLYVRALSATEIRALLPPCGGVAADGSRPSISPGATTSVEGAAAILCREL